MKSQVQIRSARWPQDLVEVRRLCWAYRDHLLSGSESMLHLTEVFYPEPVYARLMDELEQTYGQTGSGVVLAERDGAAVGCGMYHRVAEGTAEIKRVYVAVEARGSGAGEAISAILIERARADGYRRILLDTNPEFVAARRLYEKLGFVARGPYSDLPPEVARMLVFYELTL